MEGIRVVDWALSVLRNDPTLSSLVPGGWWPDGQQPQNVAIPYGTVASMSDVSFRVVGQDIIEATVLLLVKVTNLANALGSTELAINRARALLHKATGSTSSPAAAITSSTHVRGLDLPVEYAGDVPYKPLASEYRVQVTEG